LDLNVVSFNNIEVVNELKYNGETLLTYKIEFPEFYSDCYQRSLKGINKFYRERAAAFQKYCQNELFEMAVKQYLDDLANGFPVRTFEAMLMYKVTYLYSCIISLYFDRYEYTGGAHGNTTRDSQTWNLQKLGLIELRQLVSCPPDCRAYILSEVNAQIQEEPDTYFENYKELTNETFCAKNFFCVPEGVVLYYQLYDIAPYSSGIREFLLPYSYCVKDPSNLCRQKSGI
jgi:hypothetical protein